LIDVFKLFNERLSESKLSAIKQQLKMLFAFQIVSPLLVGVLDPRRKRFQRLFQKLIL